MTDARDPRSVLDDWLDRLERAWLAEEAGEREEARRVRDELTLRERVDAGQAATDLHVSDTAGGAGRRVRATLTSRTGAPLSADLRPGEPVVLWWTSPTEPDAVRATVRRSSPARVEVGLDADELEALERSPGFRLDRTFPETTFRRGRAALRAWRDPAPGTSVATWRQRLAAGPAAARPGSSPSLADVQGRTLDDAAHDTTAPGTGLNDNQRRAWQLATTTPDLALIHGPPGTGKTTVLDAIVRSEVAAGRRVLLTAASNLAVDNLVDRLQRSGCDVVRLGGTDRVDDQVLDATLDARVERHPDAALARAWLREARQARRILDQRDARGALSRDERRDEVRRLRELERDARALLRGVSDRIINDAQVLAMTAAGVDVPRWLTRPFDAVVIDEATQLTTPLALGVLQLADRAVLAGDPLQLPPTARAADARRLGLDVSLFETLLAARSTGTSVQGHHDTPASRGSEPATGLADWSARCVQLTEQYRMAPAIRDVVSSLSYDGALTGSPRGRAALAPDPRRPAAIVLVDTVARGWDEERDERTGSTRNPGHAARVVGEVRRIVARGCPGTSITVLAAYRAQRDLARALLDDAGLRDVETHTVDGFQGRENDVVVVDLVRSNAHGELGFLRDRRRLNVAISRARALCLIVGDSGLMGADPWTGELVQQVEAWGCWVSAWADEPDDAG